MNKMNAFFVWIMLNVLLPVSPLAIKASMNFFSNEEINKIAVLDGIELIYYNLFLSITMINMLSDKRRLIENILKAVFVFICAVDLIILILLYLQISNNKCLIYSIICAILVPILLCVYKYRTMNEGEER